MKRRKFVVTASAAAIAACVAPEESGSQDPISPGPGIDDPGSDGTPDPSYDSAQRPDVSTIQRFLDSEYQTIKAANEVVIDPTGGGDYGSWDAWQRASPASFRRPVCVTFRKGMWHPLPNGGGTGRIFPGAVPGTGKVILSTDGALPEQSPYSAALAEAPSPSSRVYPSQLGELAWFETPNATNHTIFGIRDNDVDVWFRGIYHKQFEGVANTRGFWSMETPADSSKFCERIQWDRCMFKGQDMSNNRETRKGGYIAGRNIGFFDCYIHQLNAGQNPVVAAAIFPTSGGPFVLWNTHLEAMGHCVYVDAQQTLPAADMLPRDGVVAYCHLYKPASWHTAGFPDYRPKTFFEVSSGSRLMLYRCLMENGLASVDGQPGINLKNKYPGHHLGAAHKSEDIVVQECWMRRVKEPFSISGVADIRRLEIKDVVCERLGKRAGFGNANYFLVDVVRSVEGGQPSPAQVHIEGLTLADADASWAYHYSGTPSALMNDGVLRNSLLPDTQWGPYSTTQGGDGAINDRIGTGHDGRGCVLVGASPSNFDQVPGMFDGCTFPADETGLYRGDADNGDWRLNPEHPSAGSGVEGYTNPGGAEAVTDAIGTRGVLVASLEVTP